jgi:hypothetical protein
LATPLAGLVSFGSVLKFGNDDAVVFCRPSVIRTGKFDGAISLLTEFIGYSYNGHDKVFHKSMVGALSTGRHAD